MILIPSPKGDGFKDPLSGTLNTLALILEAQGRIEEAVISYRQSLAILDTTVGVEHSVYAMILNNFTETLRGQGRYPEAEKLLRQAIEAHKKSGSHDTREYVLIQNSFGLTLQEQVRYRKNAAQVVFWLSNTSCPEGAMAKFAKTDYNLFCRKMH